MHKNVPVVPNLSKKSIQEKVKQIIMQLYPSAWAGKEPVPLEMLFDSDAPKMLDITTGFKDLSMFHNAIGLTTMQSKESFIDSKIIDNADKNIRHERFLRSTIGHELGHCFLHINLDKWFQSRQTLDLELKRERFKMKPFEDPEWQAWYFCKEICMPHHLVFKMLEKYQREPKLIEILSNKFNMNYSFVEARVLDFKTFYPEKSSNSCQGRKKHQKLK